MSAVRTAHTVICMLVTLLLTACASTSPDRAGDTAVVPSIASKDTASRQIGAAQAAPLDIIHLKVHGMMPVLKKNREGIDTLLASNVSAGIDDLLRYQATYSLKPGNFLESDTASPEAPTRLAGQSFDQNIRLRLPELAGTPLSLGLTTGFENNWMLAGATQSRREHVNLDWSPGPATVNVQWAESATAFDASTALNCNLQSTLRLLTHEGSDHSETWRMSGRDCVVAADDTRYAGIEAQVWGMGYSWHRPRRQSEAILSVIDPIRAHDVEYRQIEPSYELGLRHRREFGALSAKAYVSLRQASVWGLAGPVGLSENSIIANDTNWTANASLTWELQHASLSAKWAKGVNRFWFTPDIGPRSDRFGLALNLSRWLERLVRDSSPQFAMNWDWSQAQSPDDEVTGNNTLSLDLALMF